MAEITPSDTLKPFKVVLRCYGNATLVEERRYKTLDRAFCGAAALFADAMEDWSQVLVTVVDDEGTRYGGMNSIGD